MARAEIIPYGKAFAVIVRCEDGTGVAGMEIGIDEGRWPEKIQVHRCRYCGRTHRFTKRSAAVAQ